MTEDDWKRRLAGLAEEANRDDLHCLENTFLALVTILSLPRTQLAFANVLNDLLHFLQVR